MLTKLVIRNFKCFDEAEIELGNPVVFIGPNNSGKTTALQALALWHLGVRRWRDQQFFKRANGSGALINRQDVVASPVPHASLLWHNLFTGATEKPGAPVEDIFIEITVYGVANGDEWSQGFQFSFENEESITCHPTDDEVRNIAQELRFAFLQPISGVALTEDKLENGSVNSRIGQGLGAEVLRNLCYHVYSTNASAWGDVKNIMNEMFQVEIQDPFYYPESGQLFLNYRQQGKSGRTCESGTDEQLFLNYRQQGLSDLGLDIGSMGRGAHQTLMLLTYLHANPNAVLLLDEPDAHLEVLRQREIYRVLTNVAKMKECQLLIATHSEILLEEAAERDVVVAFLGTPHRINDRGFQVIKSLNQIGWNQYYQAEQKGWVLYLEGSTDLEILRAFAYVLNHPVGVYLERPFVRYVGNVPEEARNHFYGLREAIPKLGGIVLVDRLDRRLHEDAPLQESMWERREIENYLCYPYALYGYAREGVSEEEAIHRESVMRECVERLVPPVALDDPNDPWWKTMKASDDFLDRLFADFYRRLGTENLMRKTNYHQLARFVPKDLIADEVVEKLNAIVEVASVCEREW